MAKFHYKALNEKGMESSGTIEALSSKEAINLLRSQGLFPTKVKIATKQPDRTFTDQPQLTKPANKTTEKTKGIFLFPTGSCKCKLKRGTKVSSGQINLWGQDDEVSLVFQSKMSLLNVEDKLSIDVADIVNVRIEGFFRKSLIVRTNTGEELIFTGKFGRIGQVLMYEVSQRSIQSP